MTKKEIQTVNELLEKSKLGYAYLYPSDGGDRKEYAFDMTPENIASFLGKHFTNAEKMILTDMADRLILDTFGGFINNCPNQKLCREINPLLVPIQMGEKESQDFLIVPKSLLEEYYEMEERAVTEAEIRML